MSRKPTYEELEQRIKEFENAESERKQVAKIKKEQARLLGLIFEHSLDSIVLLDKDYNFIRVSETYAKACQRDSSEFPGHNHFEFYPSNFKDEADEAKKGKYIYRKSARPFIFPDHSEWGTTYWDLGLVPILDEEGEIELFLFTLKDVTERMRKEEALQRAHDEMEERIEERTAELENAMQHLTEHMDNSPLAIVEFDPQFRVIRWSKEAERVFGWAPGEIVGKSISEMQWVHNEDEELVQRESAGLLSGERRRSMNVNRNYHKDGSVIHCEWYNSGIYDTNGKLISILSQVLALQRNFSLAPFD